MELKSLDVLLHGKDAPYPKVIHKDGTVYSVIDRGPVTWKLQVVSWGGMCLASTDGAFWRLYEEPAAKVSAVSAKCTCDIHLLMREGCRCGSFIKERAANNSPTTEVSDARERSITAEINELRDAFKQIRGKHYLVT
jgi:hypothetical protein